MPNLEIIQSKLDKKRKTSVVEILLKHQENVGKMVQQMLSDFSKEVDNKFKLQDNKIAKMITESLNKYSKEANSKIEEVIRISFENYSKAFHANIENAIRLNLEKFAKEEHSIMEKTISESLTKFELKQNEKILTLEKKIKNMESTNQRLLLI